MDIKKKISRLNLITYSKTITGFSSDCLQIGLKVCAPKTSNALQGMASQQEGKHEQHSDLDPILLYIQTSE